MFHLDKSAPRKKNKLEKKNKKLSLIHSFPLEDN